MFVQREHAAEDMFRKSNRGLKELERKSRPSMSKPEPRYYQDTPSSEVTVTEVTLRSQW